MFKNDNDSGFTLVELMVVVLIIAILIAIAIPTFLGARTRAQDRAAQSELRNALTSAKVYYADTNADYGFTNADLALVDVSSEFVAGVPGPDQIGWTVHPNIDTVPLQAVQFVSMSASGTWFCVWDVASGTGTKAYFGQADLAADLTTLAECSNGW